MKNIHLVALALALLGLVVLGQAVPSLYAPPGGYVKFSTIFPQVSVSERAQRLSEAHNNNQQYLTIETVDASGNPITCEVPQISFVEEPSSSNKHEANSPVHSFLAPLKGKCFTYLEGWWTYEFCYGKHIRQYHVSAQGKTETEFFLGRSKAPSLNFDGIYEVVFHDDKELQDTMSSLKIENPVGNYYSERYEHGTVCDIQTGPRTIEIRWHCVPEASNTGIRHIKEPVSCQYVLDVESPFLCKHPTYATEQDPVHPITCWSVHEDIPQTNRKSMDSTTLSDDDDEAGEVYWDALGAELDRERVETSQQQVRMKDGSETNVPSLKATPSSKESQKETTKPTSPQGTLVSDLVWLKRITRLAKLWNVDPSEYVEQYLDRFPSQPTATMLRTMTDLDFDRFMDTLESSIDELLLSLLVEDSAEVQIIVEEDESETTTLD